jgi:hypothetical protein
VTTDGGVGIGGSPGAIGVIVGGSAGNGNGDAGLGAVELELCPEAWGADVDAGAGTTAADGVVGRADGDGLTAMWIGSGASLRDEPLATVVCSGWDALATAPNPMAVDAPTIRRTHAPISTPIRALRVASRARADAIGPVTCGSLLVDAAPGA